MSPHHLFLLATSALTAVVLPTDAAAQRADSAAFIVRLGDDTTSIERYIRTDDRLLVEAVQRSPSTTVHRLVIDYGDDAAVAKVAYEVTAPGRPQPLLRRVTTFSGDSAVVVSEQGGQTRTQRVLAKNAIPVAGPFYTPYELSIMRAVAGGSQKSSVPLLAGASLVDIPIERIGRDTVALNNQFGEPMRAHIDARGRLLHLDTPAFTTVERLRWVDLDALTREFAGRDAMGRGMGPLSPRQTYRSMVNGANIWIDYGRPAARGRPIWGGLVPYGRVWRMGANDAAHFATDRAIQVGSLTLAPGTYTMFLLPAADAWTLIFNRQTGMSGLDYDSAQDVGRVAMNVTSTSTPAELFTISVGETETGGTLAVVWGNRRGTVPISVR